MTQIAPLQSGPAREHKRQVDDDVEAVKKKTQVMVDMVLSFDELGFQEIETSKLAVPVLDVLSFASRERQFSRTNRGVPLVESAHQIELPPLLGFSKGNRLTQR